MCGGVLGRPVRQPASRQGAMACCGKVVETSPTNYANQNMHWEKAIDPTSHSVQLVLHLPVATDPARRALKYFPVDPVNTYPKLY